MPKSKLGQKGPEYAPGASCNNSVDGEMAKRFSEDNPELLSFRRDLKSTGNRACSCPKCNRRSGPVVDDPCEVAEEVARMLAAVEDLEDEDATHEVTSAHRKLAGDIVLTVCKDEPETLQDYLDNHVPEAAIEDVASFLLIPAAQFGHFETVCMLIEYADDFEQQDLVLGGTPVMHAANNGHIAIVNELLDAGAEVNAVDSQGQTALMLAVFSDRPAVVDALIKGGAEVDKEDTKGLTALCYAAKYGSVDCIAVLAEHQANAFHKDYAMESPLDHAESSGRQQAVELVKKIMQRQRLRKRREQRAAETAARNQQDDACIQAMEQQAEQNMQALLQELEAEEKKSAKKKSKKKGKREGRQGEGSSLQQVNDDCQPPVQSSAAENHVRNHGHSNDPQPVEATPPSTHTTPPEGNAAAQHQSEPAVQPHPTGGAMFWLEELYGLADEPPAPLPAPEPPQDPAVLRKKWEDLLAEAAQAVDESEQSKYITQISNMMPVVKEAGISTKYGKKVLTKLQKVGPVRAALVAAMKAATGSPQQLQVAVENARALRSYIDAKLLASAEDMLQKLTQKYQSDIWAKVYQQLQHSQGQGGPQPTMPSRQYAPPAGATTPAAAAGCDDDDECVVCLSGMKETLCFPCGHVCMCKICSVSILSSSRACPICRAPLESLVDIHI